MGKIHGKLHLMVKKLVNFDQVKIFDHFLAFFDSLFQDLLLTWNFVYNDKSLKILHIVISPGPQNLNIIKWAI